MSTALRLFGSLFASLLLALALGFADQAQAQTPKRVALLIGNAGYAVGRLANPLNDVREMDSALKAAGFQVQAVLNANQNAMKRAVRDFGDMAQGADIALLYYSGHGTQVNGENYLIPLQAEIRKESDYEVEAISANAILRQILGARPRAAIVVLDACRDNPALAAANKSTVKGLARMEAPTGTMIAFATAPGTTATDEGVYARTLARQIRTPGLELVDIFRNTTAEVRRATGGRQEPRISEMSITERVYLMASVRPEPSPSTPGPSADQIEQQAWEAARASNTVLGYEAYMREYPNGRFVSVARVAIATMKQTASQSDLSTPARREFFRN